MGKLFSTNDLVQFHKVVLVFLQYDFRAGYLDSYAISSESIILSWNTKHKLIPKVLLLATVSVLNQ